VLIYENPIAEDISTQIDLFMQSISVIIPTLNEEKNITSALSYFTSLNPSLELIVTDGGSKDNKVVLSHSLAQVIDASPGRGAQINAGVQAASGDVLWFLHADCRSHEKSIEAMLKALADEKVVGGVFEYSLDDERPFFRLVEFFSNRKNHLLKLFYGDMGIFVQHQTFDAMGGYREIPLMEDMDFCKRLKTFGNIRILPYRIITSARRWHEEGIVKNITRNWALQIAWALGTSPEKLAIWYRFRNNKI